jgi:exopolysaccharide biosynthesis polyprenyl glycosylphosphotransferase
MLKEQAGLIKKINIAVDVAALFTAFWLGYQIRSNYGGLHDIHHYAWLLLVILPLWLFLLNYFGMYSSLRGSSFSRLFAILFKVHLVGGVIVSSTIYLVEPKGFSRGFFAIFIILSFFLIGTEQLLVRSFLRFIRLQGYNFRNILLVGTGQSAERIIDLIELHKTWGLRVVGIIQPEDGPLKEEVKGHVILGTLDDIVDVCKTIQIDEVIFSTTREECRFDIEHYILLLAELGITARTALNTFYSLRSKTELSMFHNELPMMTFKPAGFTEEQLFLKRCIDIAGGMVGVLLLLLLTPFIASAIRLESPGPIFFGQTRVGENGRRFTCWKFRSMYLDAEERKRELLHLNEMGGAIFKIRDDPRVTRVGKFLRKTSLDELPQFWNVLRGEMSLVGTRPPTPDEVEKYENWQRRRISIKPGLTGLWQVSGRNSINDFNEVVRLDLKYIDSWSLSLDFKLLLKTLKVVFLREGAH